MARHRQASLDLDTSILRMYILSISVVFSRRVSSATSQLAGLFAAAVLLRELSSRGAGLSGQESPRGSLLSTDIQQTVLRRTSTLCALCIARKSVAALTGLHDGLLVLRRASKGCMQVCRSGL